MVGGFRSVLCLSVFQGSLLVIIIMIDGREKRNFVKAAFEFLSSRVCEKRSNITIKFSLTYYIPSDWSI